MNQPTVVTLTPYERQPVAISDEMAERLVRYYRRQITVEPPWIKTDYCWQLTAQDWVGYIPLTPQFQLVLQPKTSLENLFGMLEYAYRLKFDLPAGEAQVKSLPEFYERLAHILAKQVLDRARQGFYRAYLSQTDQLPFLRGRLNLRCMMQQPVQLKLECDYQEHTADVEDNRLLLYTLWRLTHSGVRAEPVLAAIRQACHTLQGLVSLQPYPPEACLGRSYHRLNQDYQSMHTLCRFFLEQTGPSHQPGSQQMLPFLIDMARLYEMFVAEWLKSHLPSSFSLKAKERVDISRPNSLHFEIDLVLYEIETGSVRSVLDTKYKTAGPVMSDIQQVISYALAKGCHEAVLVYPTEQVRPLDETVRGIRIRSLTFALSGDLEVAGQKFLQDLDLEPR